MSGRAVAAEVQDRKGSPVVLTTAWVFEGPDGVRVEKADRPSQQLPEDPFSYSNAAGEAGLENPPYDMDQLVSQLGGNPAGLGNSLHARCVKQKASDVAGRGIVLRGRELEGDAKPPTEEEDRWGTFVTAIEDDERGDGSFKEHITRAHEDYESIGWAVLEIGRNAKGELDGLWQMPAHTLRAHKDHRRFAQKRAGKLAWFKRFGLEGSVSWTNGAWSDRTAYGDGIGNEVLVIRNYTPSSSYYGLPDHIPALSALAGWNAQAMYNVRFFGNHAVPSYAVVIEGATLTPELEDLIKDHFRQIKGDPARTIVIPIPAVSGDESMQPKLRFERLSVDVKEASFRLYKQDNALEICIAHGVPPYRVGWPLIGSLGGATAKEMTAIYNDAIVQPRQETWEQRLNRALLGAKGLQVTGWILKAAELDLRDEMRDIDKARSLFRDLLVTTPNDNARFFGYDQRTDELGKLTWDQIQLQLGPAMGAGFGAPPPATSIAKANAWMAEVRELAALRKRIEGIVPQAIAA